MFSSILVASINVQKTGWLPCSAISLIEGNTLKLEVADSSSNEADSFSNVYHNCVPYRSITVNVIPNISTTFNIVTAWILS